LSTDCNITVTTDQREIILYTNFDLVSTEDCLVENIGSISDSGKYLAYQDVSQGTSSTLVLYILDYDKKLTLGILETGSVIDQMFLDDDRLVMINGNPDDFDQQWLTLFEVPMIVENYNTNVGLDTDYFEPNNISYHSTVQLPNTGETHWALDYDGEYIQTFGETGVLLSQYIPDDILLNSTSDNISLKLAKKLAYLKFMDTARKADESRLNTVFVPEKTTKNAWVVEIVNDDGWVLETYYVNSKTGKVNNNY
jgi:hypothetical protein